MRIEGRAEIVENDPSMDGVVAAQLAVRVRATNIYPNCARNVHKMELVEPSQYSPKSSDDDVATAPWADNFQDVLPDAMKPKT